MDKLETFQQMLVNAGNQIPLMSFVINLVTAAILAYILKLLYVRYGRALSNRKEFGHNFILLTMITMLIITVVKSSLALSLGLVGALSIIRFRAAIKEPEELTYVFFCIAIGLGLGANQFLITVVSFIIINVIIHVLHIFRSDSQENHLNFIIYSDQPKLINLDSTVELVKKYAGQVRLRRYDDSIKKFEAHFLVNFKNSTDLNSLKDELRKLDSNVSVKYLDSIGVY